MVTAQKVFQPGKNRLLAALPSKQRDRLLRHLTSVHLQFEEILYEQDAPIGHVYFPSSSMISLLQELNDGSVAEVGRVSNEGMIGLPVFLGAGISHTRAFVQMPGEALRMRAQIFRKEARLGGALSNILLRYTQVMLYHSERLTACNTRHSIEQRLCRWLLITQDRLQTDQLEITHEFLSQMLGIHRHSVTVTAIRLQKGGLIRYSRGKLKILDRKGLEEACCECYRAIQGRFEQLFAEIGAAP